MCFGSRASLAGGVLVCGGFLAPASAACVPLQSVVGSGSWQRVNAQTAVRSPRYAVFDLAEGKPYVFRVLSANKHGLSEPSEITAPIQAQDTIGECRRLGERPRVGQWPGPCTGPQMPSLVPRKTPDGSESDFKLP